jgi:hypothetical protein
MQHVRFIRRHWLTLICSIALIVAIAFRLQTNGMLAEYWVGPVASKFPIGIWGFILCVLLAVLVLCIWILLKWYRFSTEERLALIIYATSIYLLPYRFASENFNAWTFYPNHLSRFHYVDLFFLLASLFAILQLIGLRTVFGRIYWFRFITRAVLRAAYRLRKKAGALSIRTAFIYLLVFAVFLVFHIPIEQLLDRLFINSIISTVRSSWLIDFVALSIIAFAIYWWFVYCRRNKRFVEIEGILMLSLVSLYFLIYRLNVIPFDHWQFYPMCSFPKLAYVDLIIGFPFLILVYKITTSRGRPLKRKREFKLHNDSPINGRTQDEFFRKDLADFIADHIVHTDSETSSFAIGINAKWGNGKSSFQKMISESLQEKKPDVIQLEFNPWKSKNPQQIIVDFFEVYSSTLKRYNLSLGKLIDDYSQKLLAITPNILSQVMSGVFNPFENREEQFNEINKALAATRRKVVIFIDDIDRLHKSEVFEVIKLIRNSANFQNTFFIVGFDEEYLNNSIKSHTENTSNAYLEKIFQIQFDLSDVPPQVIIAKLKMLLGELLPQYKSEIEMAIDYKPTANEAFATTFFGSTNKSDYIPKLLDNLRDVKRFANFFALNYKQVASEVVFEEYFFLSLVKFKFPAVFKELKQDGI